MNLGIFTYGGAVLFRISFFCYNMYWVNNKTSHKVYLYGNIKWVLSDHIFHQKCQKICLCKIAKSMESTAYVYRLLTSASIWVQNIMYVPIDKYNTIKSNTHAPLIEMSFVMHYKNKT